MRPQLVLVSRKRPHVAASYERLVRRVAQEAPDIRARLVLDRKRAAPWRDRPSRLRPTLVVSPQPIRHFRPQRGRVLQGVNMDKAWELARLDAAGVPVPRWHLLEGRRGGPLPDLGPYVVSKPNLGGRGEHVRLVSADRVRWKKRYAERGGVILQEFVNTGPWPVSYRVCTMLGEPLYATRTEARHDRRPLRSLAKLGPDANADYPVVASARGGTWSLSYDEEILALARSAAATFPEIPLLGIDLVRDVDSGRCYVLEINPNGRTWHFDSESGLAVQDGSGIDFAGQFDGVGVAARRLADETRRMAC